MIARVARFPVIEGGRPRPRRRAPTLSPLVRKVAELERCYPNAAAVCELLVDNWLRKVRNKPAS
jgi:hypothetical protein